MLTKRDQATPAQIDAARAAARGVNPIAELIDIDDRAACVRATFTLRAGALPAPPEASGAAHPRISVVLVKPEAPLAWDDLSAWFDNLAGLLGERLLRIKGLVAVAEAPQPLLVQSVGTLFSAPRPFGNPSAASFLVVIARDLAAGELAQVEPRLPVRFSRVGSSDPFTRATGGMLRAG